MTDKYCTCGHRSGTYSELGTVETCVHCQLPVRATTSEKVELGQWRQWYAERPKFVGTIAEDSRAAANLNNTILWMLKAPVAHDSINTYPNCKQPILRPICWLCKQPTTGGEP